IDSLAIVLFLCALVFPVILKLSLLWVKFTTKASLSCQKTSCTVQESVPVSIMIENRCPLFFPKVYASVSVCHAFSDIPESVRLKFPLHGNNTTKLTFYVKPDCCGAVTVRIDNLKILDAMHLFHTKMKRKDSELELLVLPQKMEILLSETAEAVYSPESNHYANKAGDDPSEIFNIREYHAGDAVSRIHWKLSSKSDILFIKEFGYPIEKHVLLLAEYLSDTNTDSLSYMQEAQTFLTLIYSVALRLAETEVHTVLAWHDGNKLVSHVLKSKEQIPALFRELYLSLTHMAMDAQDLHEILAGQQYSSVTLITNDTQAELLPVLERQTEAVQKNLAILTEKELSFTSDNVSVRTILSGQVAETISGLII
ncbi:MAG: DUF58 domain-containing protein, partial [Oscillospiraceae bacterium]|nr:DUF58 domain-containing protein [Oscillospiraceae bacterium]